MTKYHELFAALAAPFEPEEVKIRGQAGRQLHYVTARTVMNRLDNVLGPENWWDSYTPGESSVMCRLTIRLPDGSELTKADAGGYAGMADDGDDDKSGFSDSYKRAAVKFGVGRYLYRDGVPSFVTQRPEASAEPAAPAPTPPPATNGRRKPRHEWPGASDPAIVPMNQATPAKAPANGKAFFGWVKDQEQRYQVGLLKYLNNWAKLQEFPGRMVDWDNDQVALAYAEAQRKLAAIAATNGHAEGY
jgi:hypothetical protein